MQGIDEIRQELGDKTIMKKTDAPQFFEGLKCDQNKVDKVVQMYQDDPKLY